MPRGRVLIVVAVLALIGVASASSAVATASKDMATAMKALNYPKTGAVKIGCRTSGAGFQCKATYPHDRVRRFYAEWASAWGDRGGFICGGATVSTCKPLRHGFVPSHEAQRVGVRGAADEVSRAYMAIHYNAPQPFVGSGCPAKTPPTYAFCYAGDNNTTIGVNITMRKVKTGYVVSAASTVQPGP